MERHKVNLERCSPMCGAKIVHFFWFSAPSVGGLLGISPSSSFLVVLNLGESDVALACLVTPGPRAHGDASVAPIKVGIVAAKHF